MNAHDDTFAHDAAQQTRNAVEQFNRHANNAATALEKTVDGAGREIKDFQLQVLEILETNIMSALDLAKKLSAAKSLPDVIQLQSAYMKDQMTTATSHMDTLRQAWLDAVSGVFEPMKRNAMTTLQRGRIC